VIRARRRNAAILCPVLWSTVSKKDRQLMSDGDEFREG